MRGASNKAVMGASLILASLLLPGGVGRGEAQQDPNFRFSQIERRLDQLQMRMDLFERAVQNQAMTPPPDTTTAMMMELQRQNLQLAEQLVQLQKRTLEMQKAIDQLREGVAPERKEKPREEGKPKAPARP
ncbi:MAG: hypothetical protein SF339_17885 [Blastocatellia bacterium]|nr:hypothetical protein [Blastocatellia bacterium]